MSLESDLQTVLGSFPEVSEQLQLSRTAAPGQKRLWNESDVEREEKPHDGKRPGEFAPKAKPKTPAGQNLLFDSGVKDQPVAKPASQPSTLEKIDDEQKKAKIAPAEGQKELFSALPAFGSAIPADQAKELVGQLRDGDESSKNGGRWTVRDETGPLVMSSLPTNFFDQFPDEDDGNVTNFIRSSTNPERVARYAANDPKKPIYVVVNRNQRPILSDGGHRLMAAIDRGDTHVPALLPQSLHDQIHGKAGELDPVHHHVAKRFGIPPQAVKSLMESGVPELRRRDEWLAESNGTSPQSGFETFPHGTARINQFGDPNESYVDYMTEFSPHEIEPTEPEDGIKKSQTYKDYVQWAKAGHQPPPVSVFSSNNGTGKLLTSSRRRTLAAREAGIEKIPAWHGPYNPETGNPLKYGDVMKAVDEFHSQQFSRTLNDVTPVEFSVSAPPRKRRVIDDKRTREDVDEDEKIFGKKKRIPTDGDKPETGWTKVGGSTVHVDDDGVIDKGCPGLKGEAVEDLIDESDESRERREARQAYARAAGITGDQITAQQAKAMGSEAHVEGMKQAKAVAEADPRPTIGTSDVLRGVDDQTGEPAGNGHELLQSNNREHPESNEQFEGTGMPSPMKFSPDEDEGTRPQWMGPKLSEMVPIPPPPKFLRDRQPIDHDEAATYKPKIAQLEADIEHWRNARDAMKKGNDISQFNLAPEQKSLAFADAKIKELKKPLDQLKRKLSDYTMRSTPNQNPKTQTWTSMDSAAQGAEAKFGIPIHHITAAMPDAYLFRLAQSIEHEALKKAARDKTKLDAGDLSRIGNQHRDWSTVPGFDFASREFASENPNAGFDPYAHDTPERVWNLIHEGATVLPPKDSPEIAELAAQMISGDYNRTSPEFASDDDEKPVDDWGQEDHGDTSFDPNSFSRSLLSVGPVEFARVKPARNQSAFNWDEDAHPREASVHDGKKPGEFAEKGNGGVTTDEKQAIRLYRGLSHADINGHLQFGGGGSEVEENVSLLDSAMKKHSLEKRTTLYRGLKTNPFMRQDFDQNSGNVITHGAAGQKAVFSGFQSATDSVNQAKSFGDHILVMDVPAGVHALDMTKHLGWSENETLLDRGLTATLNGIEKKDGTTFYHVNMSDNKQPADPESDYQQNGTRSKSFKSWFGDWEHDPANASKVVDADGEPQETAGIPGEGSKVMKDGKPIGVYHGTGKGGWDKFDKAFTGRATSGSNSDLLLYGPGFYFTEDPDVAADYAKIGSKDIYETKAPRQELIDIASRSQAALNDEFQLWKNAGMEGDAGHIKHAIGHLENLKSLAKIEKASFESNQDVLRALKNYASMAESPSDPDQAPVKTGHEAIVKRDSGEVKNVYLNIRKPFDMDGKTQVGDVAGLKKAFGEKLGGKIASAYGYTMTGEYGQWAVDNSIVYSAAAELYGGKSAANENLASMGFDGITHIGGDRMGGGHHHRVWIAFEPNQIKAVNNRGTFNPDDDRLEFSRSDELDTIAERMGVDADSLRAAIASMPGPKSESLTWIRSLMHDPSRGVMRDRNGHVIGFLTRNGQKIQLRDSRGRQSGTVTGSSFRDSKGHVTGTLQEFSKQLQDIEPVEFARIKPAPGQMSLFDEGKVNRETTQHEGKRPGEFAPKTEPAATPAPVAQKPRKIGKRELKAAPSTTVDFPQTNTYGAIPGVKMKHIDGTTFFTNPKDDTHVLATVPTHHVERFMDEISGRLTHPANSGHPTLDRVLSGNGTHIGKGHESTAFDAGNGMIVKAAVLTPFHISQHGVRTPAEANKIVDDSVAVTKHLRSAGVPGILPQYGVQHDGRSFAVQKKVDTATPLQAHHFDQLEKTIQGIHNAGYTVRDQIQAGLDHNGNAAIYDIGSASKLEGGRYDDDDKRQDFSNLSHLAKRHGVDYKTPNERRAPNDYESMLWGIQDHPGMTPSDARTAKLRLVGAASRMKAVDPDMHELLSDSHSDAMQKLEGWIKPPQVEMSRSLMDITPVEFSDRKRETEFHDGKKPGQFAPDAMRWDDETKLHHMEQTAAVVIPHLHTANSNEQDRAKFEYQKLLGEVAVNSATGMKIGFSMRGWKEVKNHSADRKILRIVPCLKKLLEVATPLWSEENTEPSQKNIKQYHSFGAKADFDGEPYYVRLVVKEQADGSLHYDHNLTSEKKMKGLPGSTLPENKQGIDPSKPIKDKLLQWYRKIKGINGGEAEIVEFSRSAEVFGPVEFGQLAFNWDSDEHPRDEAGRFKDKLHHQIKEYLSDGSHRHLRDIHDHTGHKDYDALDPLANKANAALKELRDSGQINGTTPSIGEPHFYMTEEQIAKHKNPETVNEKEPEAFNKNVGPAGLTVDEAIAKASSGKSADKRLTNSEACAATYAYTGTTSSDWNATEIKGMIEVDRGSGDAVSLPEFVMPSGYSTVPLVWEGSADNECCGLCGHNIKTVYHIQNDAKKWTMPVGSECVTKFGEGESGERLAKKSVWAINRDLLTQAWTSRDKLAKAYGSENSKLPLNGHTIVSQYEVRDSIIRDMGYKFKDKVKPEDMATAEKKSAEIFKTWVTLNKILFNSSGAPVSPEKRSTQQENWHGSGYNSRKSVDTRHYERATDAVISSWVKRHGDTLREAMEKVDEFVPQQKPEEFSRLMEIGPVEFGRKPAPGQKGFDFDAPATEPISDKAAENEPTKQSSLFADIPAEHLDEAKKLSEMHGGREVKKTKTGWQVRSPKGGKVSEVNGIYYPGGQFMPIHGLTEKKEPQPKRQKPALPFTPPKPNEDGREREPRSPMSPEQIEELRKQREDDKAWGDIQRTPLGRLLQLGDKPKYKQGTIPITDLWREYAERVGPTAMAEMKDQFEKEVHGKIDKEWQDAIDEQSGLTDDQIMRRHGLSSVRRFTPDDAEWDKNQLKESAHSSATEWKPRTGKAVEKSVPGTHYVRELIGHILSTDNGLPIGEMKRIGEILASHESASRSEMADPVEAKKNGYYPNKFPGTTASGKKVKAGDGWVKKNQQTGKYETYTDDDVKSAIQQFSRDLEICLQEFARHEFASTQLDITGELAKAMLEIGKSIPKNELSGDGLEKDCHVTVLYGLHADDTDELQELVKGFGPVTIKFGKTSIFPANKGQEQRGGEQYDVLKIDIEGDDIHRLNKLLRKMDHTSTFPKYHPHATIGYLKPGEGAKFCGKNALTGKEITFDSFMFSGKDGTKTEIPLVDKTEEFSRLPVLTEEEFEFARRPYKPGDGQGEFPFQDRPDQIDSQQGEESVQSSNMHSFRWEGNDTTGSLLVRFKAKNGGAGPLYRVSVPKSYYEGLKKTAQTNGSAGGWYWDNIRVRGSVAGHQHPVSLVGTGPTGYVPRAAGLRRGYTGEHFNERTLNGVKSTLTPAPVRKGPAKRIPGYDPSKLKLPGESQGQPSQPQVTTQSQTSSSPSSAPAPTQTPTTPQSPSQSPQSPPNTPPNTTKGLIDRVLDFFKRKRKKPGDGPKQFSREEWEDMMLVLSSW